MNARDTIFAEVRAAIHPKNVTIDEAREFLSDLVGELQEMLDCIDEDFLLAEEEE